MDDSSPCPTGSTSRPVGPCSPPVQLEHEILTHPDVVEAAMIGITDDRWGERPLACVVTVPGSGLDVAALRAHLAGRIASWWIPDQVWVLPEIPRVPTGKISKVALRGRYADRARPPGPCPGEPDRLG
ncbi:hypothetical protein O7623_15620 [Solwaraspora sp. WMMD791]|uniref:AMP-binding enzyme n=1 Tax=Solwaraspora sp. WMMD791 TaxID=3016086 RepID=UPI00249C53FE|nr:hypothetical protein [Solwaraspora sp. WMMD791]WFE24866.1 hypothetical protein O7623_15620 [Solwaraspora sp. WMMD791]